MDLDRDIRSVTNKIHNPSPNKNVASQTTNSNQGLASLIVMIAVLTIIVLFCCFAAPGIRGLCRKYVFRSCPYDDPERDNASSAGPESATPTVILLPHGRMLVVDRNVLAQLHVDSTGIDFMELSANLIRAQCQRQPGSTPSILDSDTTSKGISPTSLGFSPPAYEDIFGDKHLDLPPSYSEVSLILKHHDQQMTYLRNEVQSTENIELSSQRADNNNDTNMLRNQETSLIIRNPLDNQVRMVLMNNSHGIVNSAIISTGNISDNNEQTYNVANGYYDIEGNIDMQLESGNSNEVDECIEMESIRISDADDSGVCNACDNDENIANSDTDSDRLNMNCDIVDIDNDIDINLENNFQEDMV